MGNANCCIKTTKSKKLSQNQIKSAQIDQKNSSSKKPKKGRIVSSNEELLSARTPLKLFGSTCRKMPEKDDFEENDEKVNFSTKREFKRTKMVSVGCQTDFELILQLFVEKRHEFQNLSTVFDREERKENFEICIEKNHFSFEVEDRAGEYDRKKNFIEEKKNGRTNSDFAKRN